MALFSSASRSVKLYFTGDSTQLERTLVRTETKLKRFERVAGKQSGFANSTLIGSFSKGGAIAAGAGVLALGIKSVVDAASNAQIILGQTSVAVKDAGLSWDRYGKQIQAASFAISRSSAFDDEQVLQSFSVFIRGQKNVAKSIQLSQLAADVARGRYTDLASATQLVNKAANGQIGALRRAGIFIDKNATATEALAKLQQAYGGAAEKYSKSAAGAQDRLRVSVENLRESLGSKLLPVVTAVATKLSDASDAADKLGGALKGVDQQSGGFLSGVLEKTVKFSYYFNPATGPILGGINAINSAFGGTKSQLEDINKLADQFSNSFGLGAFPTPSKSSGVPSFGQPGFKVGKPNEVFRPGPSASLRNQFFDNSISRRLDRVQDIGSLSGQINALQGIKGTIQNQISKTKDLTRRLNLGDEVVEINRQIKGLNETIASNLKDSAQAVKDAREKLASQLKQQAEDFKSKALQLLDNRTSQRTSKKDLQDALSDLRVAKQLGSAGAIKNAQFAVANARDQLTRSTLEGGTVRATGSGTYNFNGANLHFYGVTNVKQLLAEIQKAGRHGTSQTRGVIAGRNLNLGFGV